MAAVAVRLPLGLGMGLQLLVHIWGLPERTGQSASRPTFWLDSPGRSAGRLSAEPVHLLKTMSGLFRHAQF